MIPDDTKAGAIWRCAGGGTAEVYFVRLNEARTHAWVCSQGVKRRWADRPMLVPLEDLFYEREEAREEFRKRRAAQNAEHEAWRRQQQATS